MQGDLSELLERVEFCGKRSQELQARILQLAGNSISHWLFPWGQPGVGEIKAKLLVPPPVSLRQEVGMIVNEQRSILDALACTLATRNGANHTKDVYFPITKTREGFYEDLGRRKIRKLSVTDQDAIEKLKPWLPTVEDPGDGNITLFQLHEADRVRKHRNLLKWACLGRVFPTGNGHIGSMSTSPVVFHEVGKEERLAFFTGVTCDLGVQLDIIYIEPEALAGHPVSALLPAFNDAVADIVRSFA
jgi:hypothetical protein